MDTALRTLRIVHAAMMVAAFIYVGIAEKFCAANVLHDIDTMYVAIAALAGLMVVSAFSVRRRFVTNSADILRTDVSNSAALARWRTGQMLGFAVAEAVVLYGLVVRFTGASTVHAAPFYVGGILLFLAFFPTRP